MKRLSGSKVIAIWRLGIRINKGWAGPRLVRKKCGKKGCTLEVINKSKMAQSLPNFVRTCTNLCGAIPDFLGVILWNNVKWREWRHWAKFPEITKKLLVSTKKSCDIFAKKRNL